MFGLMVFGALGLYLLISIWVVGWAIGHARKHGKSAKRWGWGAAFVMYSLVFWDWLPTVVMHKYYCATESGFWVYKTLDQWKAENPGVLETLVANEGEPSTHQGDETNWVDTYYINKRFNYISKKNGPLMFNRWRWERQLVDAKTGDVIARYVCFSTGNGHLGGELEPKFWLHSDYCIGGKNEAIKIGQFINKVKGTEK